MSYAAQYQKHIYQLNEATGYYVKIFAPVGFIKMPNELKIEPPQRSDYKNKGVRFILKSRQVKKKYPFLSGLLPTAFERWFYGDHRHPSERVQKSFCLFRFSPSNHELRIYYFNHFTLYPNEREQFICNFIISTGV
ncbi:MAG TPA: hypothetical protein PLM55_06395 [Chitinophagales bacterium]|nr:hypothetical protein [Chitinophagales bacterium]